jgi:PAS domain S-box-containing protein
MALFEVVERRRGELRHRRRILTQSAHGIAVRIPGDGPHRQPRGGPPGLRPPPPRPPRSAPRDAAPELLSGEPRVLLGRRATGVFAVDVLVTRVEEDGGFTIASFRNVEARASGEEELRASEARFRAAVETLGEGLIITDAADVVAYVNSRMTQLSGYTAEEMVGRAVPALLVPEDEQAAYRDHALRCRASQQYELCLRRKDGAATGRDHRHRVPRLTGVVGTLGAVRWISDQDPGRAGGRTSRTPRAPERLPGQHRHELRIALNAVIGYSEMSRRAREHGLSPPATSPRSTARGTCFASSTTCSTSPRSRPADGAVRGGVRRARARAESRAVGPGRAPRQRGAPRGETCAGCAPTSRACGRFCSTS